MCRLISIINTTLKNEDANVNYLPHSFLISGNIPTYQIFQAGGLLGGAAVSWLLGPAWALQSVARDGRRIFEDKAPIFSLIRRHPK